MNKFIKMRMLMVIFLVTGFLTACQKEELSCGQGETIQTRAPFGGADVCGQLNVDLSDLREEQPFIISKQEQIGGFRACSEVDDEDIDFEKEFLVGVRICSACGILRKQEVMLQCDKLVYTIEIENSDCTAITCSSYFLLIPKEYLDYPIEMDVVKIN